MSFIYSILPYEKIFEQELNKNELKSEEITYKGTILRGQRQKDNSFLIDQVISTDPAKYLDPTLAPGSTIKP